MDPRPQPEQPPQPQPTQPEQPLQQPVQAPAFNPVQPQPVSQAPLPPTTPKNSKKIALIVSVASLIFVALIALLVWFTAFRVSISTEDYKQAETDSVALQASYDKVYALTNEKIPAMIIGYQARTDDPVVAEIKNLYQDYSKKSDAFLELNALKDKDIKNDHKQFFEKSEQFTAFMDGFLNAVPSLQKMELCATAKMTNYTHKTALTVFDKAYGPCMDNLNALEASTNIAVSKYATALKGFYGDLRALHEDIQTAALAGNESARRAASNKIMSLDANTITKDADLAVLENVDSVDMSAQLKSLKEILKTKSQM